MLRLTLSFPLGVYHAQSGASPDEPEWPPSPLRLIGALLAAAHGRHHADPGPERALLQRLCEASPPLIDAPDSVAVGESAGDGVVVRLRGATRWAPRNYADARGISPRNLGRGRAEVSKAGVAIGDRSVHVIWPELSLRADELRMLEALAADVTFVGTTRSPALVSVATDPPDARETAGGNGWWPAGELGTGAVEVRVPDARTIADFDRREAARRSHDARVRSTGLIPQIAIGQSVRYARPGSRTAAETVDPRWWGDAIVLAIDGSRSELRPKAPAAYLLARAVRVALLGAFGDAGTPDEAPPILTARGGDPHCAIVPLPNVWGPHADGRIHGVAIVLPHPRRVPDLAAQRARVERGLAALLRRDGVEPARVVVIPGAGTVQLAIPDVVAARTVTLRAASYTGPARQWVTVTPLVHSRWRKHGAEGLLRQVTADCAHVGLPEPVSVTVLRGAGRPGGADRIVPVRQVPEHWRGPLQGPADHVEIKFAEKVGGPLLLGKARHFGLGLCVPVAEARTPARRSDAA